MKVFKVFLIGAMFLAGILAYPYLPETLPVHWNFAGEPDNFGSKNFALFMFPAIALLVAVLFPFLSKIDPKKNNYEKFKKTWEWFQLLIMAIFAYFYFVQLYVYFNPENSQLMTNLMLSGLGVFFVLIGNFMGKIRQNFFVGVKTPWTLSDPEVWQKTQRLSGWLFVIVGLIFLIEAWLQLYFTAVFSIAIFTLVVFPFGYSYYLFKKKS